MNHKPVSDLYQFTSENTVSIVSNTQFQVNQGVKLDLEGVQFPLLNP